MPESTRRQSPISSSAASLSTLSLDADAAAARPRNRRIISNANPSSTSTSTSLFATGPPSPSPSRGASPLPSARLSSTGAAGARNTLGDRPSATGSSAGGKGLGSWATSWASVQDLAASWLSGGEGDYDNDYDRKDKRNGSRPGRPLHRTSSGVAIRSQPSSWGPEPPGKSRPRIEDVAAGSLAQREAALKARKTASVLESHEGVNGGLDVAGKFKQRSSDENLRGTATDQEVEDQLVYIHHVQPTDTYVGIVLKYRCREDVFRKANGLWSRDNIQIRKWLMLPVDACEIRGRPCEGPSYYSQDVDLLATTPQPTLTPQQREQSSEDDFFGSSNGKAADQTPTDVEERPWTHVKWVTIDSIKQPVEIARVSRKALGFFPPRRKKSLHTVSTLSTPRGSIDVPSITLGSEAIESPGSTSSRRHSLLNRNRPQFAAAYASSAPTPSRSRVGSGGPDDLRPAWMKRPGGVGTMGRSVKMPGPEKDYFNSWAKKHMPGLNLESMPSMSIMGSETAHLNIDRDEVAGIVESPFGDGRDVTSTTRQGSGLDKAAAAIETWLRGAFAKRPGTPLIGPLQGRQLPEEGDLIELEDTNSDDGRTINASGLQDQTGPSLQHSMAYGSSSRSTGEGTIRGRTFAPATSIGKGKKAD